jgi:2-polyprenyl-6-methoxyphenol hydroxylase-like FAD-dependent oxidoreductase
MAFNVMFMNPLPEIKPVGVGINILPHASKFLCESLGLEDSLSKLAVLTKEAIFFNRFGQKIYSEPSGRYAGYDWPQFSIHRGDLQMTLLEAFLKRVGEKHLHLGMDCTRVDEESGKAYFKKSKSSQSDEIVVQGDAVIACDGVHSVIRKQLHPTEGKPLYSGVNMWRGVTIGKPFLSEASMVRAGWLTHGKMVIYPIRNNIDGQGNQLINWVAEIETPNHLERDWNKQGKLEDFIHAFEDWHFDWLDVPKMIRSAERILEFPMIDQDPLPFWTRGKVTLLGDAAHPMYPRGSNGAGQSILDAQCLAKFLTTSPNVDSALQQYRTFD